MEKDLLKIIEHLEENIKRELNFKINRTLERIESGYYEK